MAGIREEIRDLKERCTGLRSQMQVQRSAASEDLADYWPGGALNKQGRPLHQWIRCFANYLRLMERASFVRAQTMDDDTRQREQTRALRAAPVNFHWIQSPAGVPDPVQIHPKGYDALLTIAELGRRQTELLLWRDQLEAQPDLGAAVLHGLSELAKARARLEATFAWIATHPGPGLPYADRFQMPWYLDELPPEWCWDLDPEDSVRLSLIFNQVNIGRLQCLPRADAAESKSSWSTFFSSMAEVLGITPAEAMSEHAVSGLIAHSALVADQRRRATASAKAKAQQDGKAA